MTNPGPAGTAGLHHHDRRLPLLPRRGAGSRTAWPPRSTSTWPSWRPGSAGGSATTPIRCWSASESGAKFSMPRMMETVLSIRTACPMNPTTGWPSRVAAASSSPGSSYRRLIQMFGKTVLDIDGEHFEHAIDLRRRRPRAPPATWTSVRGRPARAWSMSVQEHHPRQDRPGLPAGPAGADGPRGQRPSVFNSTWNAGPGHPCTGARSSGSRPTSVRPSTSSRWCSATWAWTPAPAWRSPATRAAASRASTATTCRTPRAAER